MIKTCEGQKACRDEALELVKQFEPFLMVESHIQELKQREATRQAVEMMSRVIQEAATYIMQNTSDGVIGRCCTALEITRALSIIKAACSIVNTEAR